MIPACQRTCLLVISPWIMANPFGEWLQHAPCHPRIHTVRHAAARENRRNSGMRCIPIRHESRFQSAFRLGDSARSMKASQAKWTRTCNCRECRRPHRSWPHVEVHIDCLAAARRLRSRTRCCSSSDQSADTDQMRGGLCAGRSRPGVAHGQPDGRPSGMLVQGDRTPARTGDLSGARAYLDRVLANDRGGSTANRAIESLHSRRASR
jgi:hypothetical protein